MILEEIKKRYYTEPFRPFVIVMKEGDRLMVKERFLVAFPNDRAIAVDVGKGIEFFAVTKLDRIEDVSGSARDAA